MSIINSYYQWREKYLQLAVESMKKTYVALLHPHRKAWRESTHSLRRYNYGSLGNTLYFFLKSGGIDLQAKYESHDIYHILSGYGLGIVNEARLFFFLFGNGKKTLSIIGSMLVAILFMPDQWKHFIKHYHKGKSYYPIYKMDYQELLHINFFDLKMVIEQKTGIELLINNFNTD